MRHLFVINPVAKKVKKNKPEKIKSEIINFFKQYPDIKYDIYCTVWCRDSVSYIRSYITDVRATSDETVRVHSIGGTGTLFEVINGIHGFPNVEVAAHPYGTANVFNRYFGKDAFTHFDNLKNMVFDETVDFDIIKCGNNYGICFGSVALEASCDLKGDAYIEKKLPANLSYKLSGLVLILGNKNLVNHYRVEVDGVRHDGEYVSFLIANMPCYSTTMCPAPNAHPDDGKLEVFLIKKLSRLKMLYSMNKYTSGGFQSIKEVCHLSGKKIKISTDDAVCMNIDGETFFGMEVEYELIERAVKVVCPHQIDLGSLPLWYSRPDKGTKSEACDAKSQ